MTSSKNCWSCDKKIDYKDFFCNACGALQEPFDSNPFDTFSIEKKFEIDKKYLEERYLKLQTLLHPDKFINASQEEKNFSNIHTSCINNSFKVLSDDIGRIKVLLEYFGYQISENESFQDITVLEEIMELQNMSMSVESDSEKKKIKSQLKEKIENEIKKVSQFFNEKKYKDVHKSCIKLSYLKKINGNLK
ncbi:MAG: Fe-S protein assembly co-chaperone HscB [Rickettsiales bacterium]|nr:Fe-S protein assembly co-chaperone HscB [Rickettsiales bacterium]